MLVIVVTTSTRKTGNGWQAGGITKCQTMEAAARQNATASPRWSPRRAESNGETFRDVRLTNFAPILNSILTKAPEMLYCVTVAKWSTSAWSWLENKWSRNGKVVLTVANKQSKGSTVTATVLVLFYVCLLYTCCYPNWGFSVLFPHL
jgi:hypothetical protein